METIVTSPTKNVTIGGENPFCIIGERINPTGRKIFQEQVRAGDLSAIIKDVIRTCADMCFDDASRKAILDLTE